MENGGDSGGDEDSEEDDDDDGSDDDEDGEEEICDVDDDDDGDEIASNNSDIPNVRFKSQSFARWSKGYDENDSFIDNTEALEERLASNKMPKHGKFYVNKDQKIQLIKTKPNKKSDEDEDSSNVIVKKAARKLSSSSSDNSIEEIPVKKVNIY
jgi:hypothetical protein